VSEKIVDAKEKPAEAGPKELPGAGTPAGDKLREAHASFTVGNYARLRELCDALAQDKEASVDVLDAARGLRRRTEIDSFQIVVLSACFLILQIVAFPYVF